MRKYGIEMFLSMFLPMTAQIGSVDILLLGENFNQFES